VARGMQGALMLQRLHVWRIGQSPLMIARLYPKLRCVDQTSPGKQNTDGKQIINTGNGRQAQA